MATLGADVQTFIVQRLACFDTPSQVEQAVKLEFGIEVSRQQVQFYDPTVGKKPAQKWCELFQATRAAYVGSVAEVGIAHPRYRLDRLQDLLVNPTFARNPELVMRILREARDETGSVAGAKAKKSEEESDRILEVRARWRLPADRQQQPGVTEEDGSLEEKAA